MSSAPSVSPAPYFKGYRFSNLIWWVAALVAATLTVMAALNYPGQRLIFAVFVLLSCLMVALIVPMPRLYGYTFLAAFLFLGFYAKTVAYLALGIALVEPTGSFNGTGGAWDAAMATAVAGCGGVVVSRLIHLIGARFTGDRARDANRVGLYPPSWYVRHRAAVIGVSMAAIIGFSLLNLFSAFYQVGVAIRLVLPMHLNVVASWLITTGFALWAANLFMWEIGLYPENGGRRLVIPFVEAIMTVSTLSRAAYLFRALSYVAVLANDRNFYRLGLTNHWRRAWLLLLPAGFLLSLIGVSTLRAVIYPSAPPEVSTAVGPPSQAGSATQPASRPSQRLGWAAHEISTLVVGRWIGIEGTMAVSSYPDLGLGLFGRAVVEDPRTGESSTYQRISGSVYNTSRQFVFLTTPGAVAILYYSGSIPLVALGMAVVTGLLLIFEVLASRVLANPLAVSILSLSLANAIAQADFPYLLMVAFLEQSAAVLAFGIFLQMGGQTKVLAADPEMSV
jgi:hypothetical protein